MPFDGTNNNPIVTRLDEALAKLDGGRLWCQRYYTQPVRHPTTFVPVVLLHCAVGALFDGGNKAIGAIDVRAYGALKEAAEEAGFSSPEDLNDSSEFAAVKAMYGRAREIANAL